MAGFSDGIQCCGLWSRLEANFDLFESRKLVLIGNCLKQVRDNNRNEFESVKCGNVRIRCF